MKKNATRIPFNRAAVTGNEFKRIREAIAGGHLSSGGPFSARCEAWLERTTGCRKAVVTHSGTDALELAALVSGIGPGDEVIMPSYTFVTTANAFVLRGARPVFVDIRPETMNLDERLIPQALTRRTKAIVPVHYGGQPCEMGPIMRLARRRGLTVIEDAAHGLLAYAGKRHLGTLGHLGILSFHESKNVTSGEGGALLVNDARFVPPVETAAHEGTDRLKFLRGEVDRYSWTGAGSSYRMSDLAAAFLHAQLEAARDLTAERLAVCRAYHAALAPLEKEGLLVRPRVRAGVRDNAHMYYVLLDSQKTRDRLIAHLDAKGVQAVFHYVPLHSSPGGRKFARTAGSMRHTERAAATIVRLPVWAGLGAPAARRVARHVAEFFGR